MPTVVAIHNTVNERAWREVMAWEALYAARCPDPKLKKFMGRPQDFSPKARFLNLLVCSVVSKLCLSCTDLQGFRPKACFLNLLVRPPDCLQCFSHMILQLFPGHASYA
jgi:hypothetical protein